MSFAVGDEEFNHVAVTLCPDEKILNIGLRECPAGPGFEKCPQKGVLFGVVTGQSNTLEEIAAPHKIVVNQAAISVKEIEKLN